MDKVAKCDGCDEEFAPEKEGSDGIDNSICGKCLNESKKGPQTEPLS